MNKEKLCYIEGNFAYFTTQDLKKQWGDDWNDAPYEHNAGEPYEWDSERGVKKYEILKVAFECGCMMNTPCDSHSNSPWSVEDINTGKIAWLSTLRGSSEQVVIPAGVSIKKFDELIKKVGGTVYYNREKL